MLLKKCVKKLKILLYLRITVGLSCGEVNVFLNFNDKLITKLSQILKLRTALWLVIAL
jgi:hypothetical protein